MKRELLSIVLAAALTLGVPAAALEPKDFSGGALTGIAREGEALLVTDTYNKVIWRVEGNTVTNYAGKIGVSGLWGEPVGGYYDGPSEKAMFLEPWGIAPYLNGYAVTDAEANVVRYLDGKQVQTAAGSGKSGKTNGSGKTVSFDRPTGLAAGENGELYIADTGNGLIRRLDQKGAVTTWASGLVEPTGLCWADGALYVAETGRSRICRIVDGKVTPVSGGDAPDSDGVYSGGYVDGPVEKARFEHPQGVAVGADGAIYVADTGNGAVRKISGGRVTTLAAMRKTPEAPVEPKGLLLKGSDLLAADAFAQNLLTISTAPAEYTDVAKGSWYERAIVEATGRGLTDGVGNGLFSPDLPVTRGMFITMLSRMHQVTDGSAVIDGKNTFADLEAQHPWYETTARWGADMGITLGSDGQFQGERSITREDLVVMLHRYAKAAGCAGTDSKALKDFSDAQQVADYAREAMEWAVANGVLQGNPDGTLAPKASASRAQTAQMLINFMDRMGY